MLLLTRKASRQRVFCQKHNRFESNARSNASNCTTQQARTSLLFQCLFTAGVKRVLLVAAVTCGVRLVIAREVYMTLTMVLHVREET